MTKPAKRRSRASEIRRPGLLLVGFLVACGGSGGTPDPDGGAGGGGAGGGLSTGGGEGGGFSSGGGSQTGSGGGTASGGGSSEGTYCKPCVDSSDCGKGGLCLGDIGHCGTDCSQGQACQGQAVCQFVNIGKAPAGDQCLPDTCGGTRVQGLDCSDTWSSYADDFFGTNCRGCHTGWLATPTDIDSSVRMVIDLHDMPPGGGGLTDADRRRILTWIACGGTPSSSPSAPTSAP